VAAKDSMVGMSPQQAITTMESLAATAILREEFPELKVRFVNVVDLFKLVSEGEHPHGLSDWDFDSLFTPDKPVIFNFHGYPWLIHKLVYRRSNQDRIHVRGYKEEGNINTPLELAINNQVDRFNLVIDVINRVPKLGSAAAHAKERMKNKIIECLAYAHEHGRDQDEIVSWKWPYKTDCPE
ncbi:MAG: phosphoketolase, partial [Cyanobacteria bacterium J06636_28]